MKSYNVVNHLLTIGHNINEIGHQDKTLLNYVVTNKDEERFHEYLKRGAEIKQCDLDSLYVDSCIWGNESVIQKIRDEIGSVSNQIAIRLMPNLFVYRPNVVEDLVIRYGLNLRAKNMVGNTILHVLVRDGTLSLEACDLFIKMGFDPTLRNNMGHTALRIATIRGNRNMIEIVKRITVSK